MNESETGSSDRRRNRETNGSGGSGRTKRSGSDLYSGRYFSAPSNINPCNEGQTGSVANRGQMLHDYVFGIGLFLLIVAGILVGVLPTVLAPFEDTVGGDRTAQADRIAERVVTNSSVDGEANLLDVTTLESIVTADQAQLRDRYTLPRTTRVNLTVTTMDGSRTVDTASGEMLATAAGPGQQPSATSARVVRLSDDSCPTACRLVVRVW